MYKINDFRSWRDLLGEIISDPQEKQRIAQILKINPVTLSRWCSSTTKPRYDNIRLLLEALPHYQAQFAEFLADDFPQLFNDLKVQEDDIPEIPSAFYGRILNAYTSSPPILRSSTIDILILQQILAHIDPTQQGLSAIIIQCMPPNQHSRVLSLRKTYGRGTLPWINHDYQTQFFGAESQVGQAVVSGHPIVVQCRCEKSRLFPSQLIAQEESSVAYPILQADRTAGCLLIICKQPHYFSQMRLDLVKYYADLLALAFEPDEFYDLTQIELGIMPEGNLQQPLLTRFQSRVTQKMIQSAQHHPLTRPQAEILVWQELEQELLALTLSINN